MIVTGIVAEYNPFHNGHFYHLEQARQQTNADFLVVVMSGDFVQRGAPAILCKEERAYMALEAGADLVLELPVCFATACAERFAGGAVSLLHRLGCVDFLCFGSESANLEGLSAGADLLLREGAHFRSVLRQNLAGGATYAAAMEEALKSSLAQEEQPLSSFLASPNDLLGMEYIKALRRLQSPIAPICILRRGASHTDAVLSEASYSSASAIRAEISANGVTPALQNALPAPVFQKMCDLYGTVFPIVANDFSSYLNYARLTAGDYRSFCDISEELANRMEKQRFCGYTFEQAILAFKTRQYTYSRISRGLLHLMLGITNEMPAQPFPDYARVLGFRTRAVLLLREIKSRGSIPLVTKLASAPPNAMLSLDIRSSHLYRMAVYEKFGTRLLDEYRRKIWIVPQT